MREVLRRITPEGFDPTWVASAMDLPESRLRRPGEFLRFEMLMHELRQHGLDPDLRALDCYDACEQPNYNHSVLADLIRKGAVVITTNFDRLIEIAWQRLPEIEGRELRVAVFDEEFEAEPAPHVPTLWKIHGSVSRDGEDTRISVQATLTSMLSTSMTGAKSRFLSSVLDSRELVVLGYSGYDDLDMIPVLANTASRRRLYWIEHSSDGDDPTIRTATEILEASTQGWESDAVGRDRMWYSTGPGGETIRQPEDLLLVRAPTRAVVEALAPSATYPVETERAYRFGAAHPRETQAYFEAWASGLERGEVAKCEAVAALFQLRRFRPETGARLAAVDERLAKLRRSSQDPHDTLMLLNEEYDALVALPSSRRGRKRQMARLRKRVLRVDPGPMDLGHQRRLLACMAWELEGEESGTLHFVAAAQLDRDCGNRAGELATLTTWRGHAGFGPWGDFVPPEVSQRIEELAHDIGYLPVVWGQEVLRYWQVLPEGPALLPVFRKMIRMQRHAVDVGDVLGEARASVLLGRVYLLDRQPDLAVEELLRALELNRLLDDRSVGTEVTFGLSHCENLVPGQAKRMHPWLRRSMWAGRDEGE